MADPVAFESVPVGWCMTHEQRTNQLPCRSGGQDSGCRRVLLYRPIRDIGDFADGSYEIEFWGDAR